MSEDKKGETSDRVPCLVFTDASSGRVGIGIGDGCLLMDPDQADELAADLRRRALELRHGGKVPGLTS